MKKEKFDKYTEYINAFKVAADELSKQNIDTNDNGIEIKKNKEGEDEPELTNGQKSLVWEADEDYSQEELALANIVGISPDDLEWHYGNLYTANDSEYFIGKSKDDLLRSATLYISTNMEDYIWDIANLIEKNRVYTISDVFASGTLEGGDLTIEGDKLAEIYLDLSGVKSNITNADYNGKTFYIMKLN